MTKVAINGFGRIGRLVARALMQGEGHGLELVAINDLGSSKDNAWLFERDSVHGRYKGTVSAEGNDLVIDGKHIKVTAERDPANLPHGELGVDIVLECTGFFTDRESAQKHIDAGARKVLISAPAKGVDLTVVYGVNDDKLSADHTIVSNASCTTNCLAPVAKVLNDAFGIERGLMTTVHAYTNDQKILDQVHSDPRRARAAAMNIIPTTTGAARAVGEVLPELKGKLDGSAIRVPTPDVSLIDLTFTPKRDVTKDEVNAALKAAADGPMKGVLAYTDLPLVSIDLMGDPASSTVDSLETAVLDGKLVRVVSWYDNEWGFSNRMVDTAAAMAKLGVTGRLAGIARHARPKGPMEVIERASVTLTGGIQGDFRGAMKGKPHKRQVTLMEAIDWEAAQAQVGHNIPWQERRANLLVDGLDLPQRAGVRIRVGTALLETTVETDPCERMEKLAEGLRAALTPDWRGGVCTKVVEEGTIEVGDEVRIEA